MNKVEVYSDSVSRPHLPCVVFAQSPVIWSLLIGAFALVVIPFVPALESNRTLLMLLMVGGIFESFYRSLGIMEVLLTPRYAEIKRGFVNVKKKTVDLQDYYILIKSMKRSLKYRGKHYSYGVFLIPKNLFEVHLDDNHIIQDSDMSTNVYYIDTFGKRHNLKNFERAIKKIAIPLSPYIFMPKNVKQYIDAIQYQVEVPIQVIFSSEQIKRDYMTGKYRS